jgi:UDP-glucose 4-epimerase
MKILIIGSCGFIGSSLSYYLKKKGHKLYCCDILPHNITAMDVYFPIQDLKSDLDAILTNNSFDVCINTSGAADVSNSITDPGKDFSLNSNNVFHILETLNKKNKLCKFINLSSAAVYGNPVKLPIQESSPVKPLSPYGWHKYISECISKEFYEIYNMPTCNLRIFSAYGPGIKKQLFWDLYQKSLNASEIKIFGTGQESRDFIYIDDLSCAIEKVLFNSRFQGEVINIASGKEILIKEAVETFYKILKPEKNFSFTGEERKGDPNNWCADITEIKKLGFSPTYSFEEGIEQYIKWVKEEK